MKQEKPWFSSKAVSSILEELREGRTWTKFAEHTDLKRVTLTGLRTGHRRLTSEMARKIVEGCNSDDIGNVSEFYERLAKIELEQEKNEITKKYSESLIPSDDLVDLIGGLGDENDNQEIFLVSTERPLEFGSPLLTENILDSITKNDTTYSYIFPQYNESKKLFLLQKHMGQLGSISLDEQFRVWKSDILKRARDNRDKFNKNLQAYQARIPEHSLFFAPYAKYFISRAAKDLEIKGQPDLFAAMEVQYELEASVPRCMLVLNEAAARLLEEWCTEIVATANRIEITPKG